VDGATIKNSVFSESSQFSSVVELYSWSQILYTDVHSSGDITLYPNVSLGAGILYEDPLFSNAAEGLFNLEPESVLYDYPGTEGVAYGDRRRHDPSVIQALNHQPINSFDLISNYPNPFNSGTNLKLSLTSSAWVEVFIYNLKGQQLSHPVSQRFTAGSHTVPLKLDHLESGLYFCKVFHGDAQLMTKLTVIK